MDKRQLAVVVPLFLLLAACSSDTAVEQTTVPAETTTTTLPEATTTTEPPVTTTTAPPETTTTSTQPPPSAADLALEYEADVQLINELWSGEQTAWAAGFDTGVEFWVDNNYPDMGCTFDDYLETRFRDGRVEDLGIERAAEGPTIELDEGWIIPGGRLAGTPASGRVYTMSVATSSSAQDTELAPPPLADLHVTILDGSAHFFFGCS